MTRIVGRERELDRIAAFLEDGAAAACVLVQGEAGVGKTALWQEGLAVALTRGYTVLRSRPLELDIRIPFAGLRDLLGGDLEDVLAVLPGPQRRALEVALLLADPVGAPPEPGAIAFALHSGLEVLARRAPVLIGIDDVQWLDEPSLTALCFALHRLDSAATRLLVAERPASRNSALGFEHVFEPGRLEAITLGPLSLGSIQHILKHELGLELARPLLLKVHAAAGGNPLFAIEIARALERRSTAVSPGSPLPVPDTLSGLVREHLASLPAPTLHALEIASLLAAPTTALVRAAADGEVDLAPAVSAGVAELDFDRIRFRHPLLASGVAGGIDEPRRRKLHTRLARLVTDVEERARHLALGASGEDPAVAAALEEAAGLASARGAPEVAADLLEQALMHTSNVAPERATRLIAAAEATHLAGDPERALTLAEQALAVADKGNDRARALLLLGEIDGRIAELEMAIVEAGEDTQLRARVRIELSQVSVGQSLGESLRHARAAVADASAAEDAALLAQALAVQAWYEAATTTGEPMATVARAARSEAAARTEARGDLTAEFTRATLAMWRDEHRAAIEGFEAMRKLAESRGRVYDQAHALLNLAQVQWRQGDWARADDHIEAAVALWPRGDPTARSLTRWISAVLASHRGRLEEARFDAQEGLVAAGDHGLFRARNLWVIGFVDLCAGDVDEAIRHLGEAQSVFDALGAREPGMRLFTSDLLEALIAAGRLDDADTLSDHLRRTAGELRRTRATVIGARGHALVLAARGELDGALHTLAEAVAVARDWPVPFEQARTLLALGGLQRRARKRREARATLTQAKQLFAELGAPVFAQRAEAELARIAGRSPIGQTLTPSEQRIAELVARGCSNREVASELVLTVHTVESVLTRIYEKLGVRSRSQLAHRFAAQAAKQPPASGGTRT